MRALSLMHDSRDITDESPHKFKIVTQQHIVENENLHDLGNPDWVGLNYYVIMAP